MQPFMWRTVQVHLNYNKSVIITHVCLCLLCLHFSLMSVLTFLLITSPFSHFRAGGSRKPRDWQACASSPQDDTLLPLPLPGWQTCFLCRSTPSPSLSPLILASGREEGSVRLRYMAALKKKKSVQWVFVYVYKWGSVSYHTLLNTNLAHYSLAGAWADMSWKSRPVPATACLWFTIIIFLHSAHIGCLSTVFRLPALWKVRAFDSKNQLEQVKN